MPKVNKEDRIFYLDLLRVFACAAVMIVHISSYGMLESDVYMTRWHFFQAMDSLSRFCVPVFVMISGIIFLDPDRTISFRRLYRHSIVRVVSAFLFWNVLYALYHALKTARCGESTFFRTFILRFCGVQSHLVFLFAIVGLYIVVPILRKIAEDRRLVEYFIVLSVIFCNIMNGIRAVPVWGQYIGRLMDYTNMNLIMGYAGYYFIGHYIHVYGLPKRIREAVYALGVISIVFTVALTSRISLRAGSSLTPLYGYLMPNTFFYSLSVFLLIKEAERKYSPKGVFREAVVKIAPCTFGMYLVHEFVNLLLIDILQFKAGNYPAAAVFFVQFGVVFVLSYLITIMFGKIRVMKKFVL